jgi:hydrogenase-4 component B
MFPVHVWLPKAHPVAPSPASALLSGILTKVGIFGILMTGTTVLFESRTFGTVVFVLGLVTMFLGALLALFSVNLKRTLACSSMSQIGFILVGIGSAVFINAVGGEEAGEGLALALSGTVLHMVNHSLLKLVLFMAAGVVVMNLHTLTLDEIRGWGRNKTALKIAFALGGLGISGIPLLNGYISKTMLHEGIVETVLCAREFIPGEHGMIAFLQIAEWVFLVSGGFTFAYMLKLFICIFVERNNNEERQAAYEKEKTCMDVWSTAAVCGSSVFMVLLGQPAVMKRLALFMTGREHIMEFHAFTITNLKGGLISLAIGAAVYLLIVRKGLMRGGSYVNLWPEKLDLEDLLYRPLLTSWLPGFFGAIAGVFGENLILRPVCRGVFFAATVFGRALSTSMDALIVLLRRTVMRETKVRSLHSEERRSRAAAFRDQTEAALNPIVSGFSFALVMTCIGILLILGVLINFIN